MDASCVFSSVVGQRRTSKNELIGKPVQVRPVRFGQVKQFSADPRLVLRMDVERHAETVPTPVRRPGGVPTPEATPTYTRYRVHR